MRPKKSLGQNFLINANAAKRIASLLELKPGEQVLEIGGGRGDLTLHLLATGAEVTTVELDKRLILELKERFRELNNLHLHQGSILEFDPSEIAGESSSIKLAGNIPYNLTTPILEWIVNHRQVLPEVVLMVQKEVADRITAKPGGKEFGSLTLFIQLFYSAAKVFDLKPGSFFPPPKVSSSVIKLQRHAKDIISEDEYPFFRRLTSACFRWRRKQIVRILREEYLMEPAEVQDLLGSLEIEFTSRPEQLSLEQFVAIMRKIRCLDVDSS